MFVETLLSRFMESQTKSILTFDHGSPTALSVPPQPEQDKNYLLYLHVPFCEQLCPYCSFNRVRLDRPLAEAYFQALEQEIRIYHERGYVFDSIYVGGGTPTVLPDELGSVIRMVTDLWPIRQISVETNPNHLSAEITDLLKGLGVNRLSVGVQSFQDSILRAIGRYEKYGSGAQIQEQLRAVRGSFDTVNIDMIFNFPMQDEQMLVRDLTILKALEADQVTFYPLMAARQVRRELEKYGKISHSREKRYYNRIWEELTGSYRPSSAWCFSRIEKGGNHLIDEYIVTNEEYAGLGSGSFGYIRGSIYANTFSIPRYIEALRHGDLPVIAAKRFSRLERIRYDFLMKMFGGSLDMGKLRKKHNGSLRAELWKELLFFRLTGALSRSRDDQTGQAGLPPGIPGVLELNRKGYYFLIILMREFFTGVNNFREACLSMDGTADPKGEKNIVRSV